MTNNDSVPRTLSLEVFLPFDYVFLEKPGVIQAGETATVRLNVFPQKNSGGSSFSGKIIARLGLENAEKSLRINVYDYALCPVNVFVLGSWQKSPDGKNVFMVFSSAENTSGSTADFSIKEVKGLPMDWRIETDNGVLLNALETRVFQTAIFPASSFHGTAEMVYLCEGREISRAQGIDFEQEDFLSAGLFGLSGFSGQTGLIPGGDFFLDISLVLVASVLLVMFISRLVRIIVEKQEAKVTLASQRNQSEGDSTIVFSGKQGGKLEELKSLVAKERETRRK